MLPPHRWEQKPEPEPRGSEFYGLAVRRPPTVCVSVVFKIIVMIIACLWVCSTICLLLSGRLNVGDKSGPTKPQKDIAWGYENGNRNGTHKDP